MEYADRELETLTQALCAVFVLVARSDGNISGNEKAVMEMVLERIIPALRLVDDPMEEAAMAGLLELQCTDEMMQRHRAMSDSALLDLVRRGKTLVVSKESAQTAERYGAAMAAAAREVAEASRSLLGFGAPVGQSERAMMARISRVLQGE